MREEEDRKESKRSVGVWVCVLPVSRQGRSDKAGRERGKTKEVALLLFHLSTSYSHFFLSFVLRMCVCVCFLKPPANPPPRSKNLKCITIQTQLNQKERQEKENQ